jgi:hypothetical protein
MTHYDQREDLYAAQQAQAKRAARDELPGNATDTLNALVRCGPLASGHIPSKAGLNYLLERKLAVQMRSGGGAEQSYMVTTAGRLLHEARRNVLTGDVREVLVPPPAAGPSGPRGDDIPAIAALLEGIPEALRDHEDVLRCVTLTVQAENFRPAERFPGELPHLRNKVRDLLALHARENEEPARTPPLVDPGPAHAAQVHGDQSDYARHVANGGHTFSLPEPSHAHGVDPNGGHSFAIREPAPHAHGFTVDPNGGHSMSISPPGESHGIAPFALTGEFRQSGRVLEHGVTLRARIYADGAMVIDNPERPLVVYPAAHVGAHALEPLTITLQPDQCDEVLSRIEQWTKGDN